MTAESALVILVPEAEPIAGPFRDRFDPSAEAGVPAHITLLYPFKPPDSIDTAVTERLRRCFERFTSFRFALAETRRFPGVLYLAPDPATRFRTITEAIWREFPESPPYAGRYPDIVPHLCVAQIADEQALDGIAAEFAKAAHTRLPIEAMADTITLLERRSTLWRPQMAFPLGPPARSAG